MWWQKQAEGRKVKWQVNHAWQKNHVAQGAQAKRQPQMPKLSRQTVQSKTVKTQTRPFCSKVHAPEMAKNVRETQPRPRQNAVNE